MKKIALLLIAVFIFSANSPAFAISSTTENPSSKKSISTKKIPAKKKIVAPKKATPAKKTEIKAIAEMNLMERLEKEGNFSVFITLAKSAGIYDGLANKGPFTLFVPNDAAFKKVPKASMDMLQKDTEFLKHILKYHVLGAELLKKDMSKYGTAQTAQGSKLAIDSTDPANPKIDGAGIVQNDIKAKNGVIHVIDSVLMPAIHQ